MDSEQNLSEALKLLGIRHEPSKVPGKRAWHNDAGEYLGAYDAHEGWRKLREITAQVESGRTA